MLIQGAFQQHHSCFQHDPCRGIAHYLLPHDLPVLTVPCIHVGEFHDLSHVSTGIEYYIQDTYRASQDIHVR